MVSKILGNISAKYDLLMFVFLPWVTEPGYVATVSALVQAAVTLLNEVHSLPRRSVQSHSFTPPFLSAVVVKTTEL